MTKPDFNLLAVLDVLLAEGSVAGAAKRLRLSPSAMSRALARLRKTTGDPLLVRAGRGLVPTPRAIDLRDHVHHLVQDTEAVLRPAAKLDLGTLVRTFTLRTREGFVENFGTALVARAREASPGVTLAFVQKLDRESSALRDGTADLETGVVGKTTGPEVRTRVLFRDRYVGVVRAGHALSKVKITAGRFVSGKHVAIARRDLERRPIDVALEEIGLERDVVTIVDSFSSALALARSSDLIATVPERQTGNLRAGMHTFALPVRMPELTISLLWHPRLDADPAHRWLRGEVVASCAPAVRTSPERRSSMTARSS